MSFSTLLLPLDGSPLAARALPFAATLAARGRAKLVLFRALPAAGAVSGWPLSTPEEADADGASGDAIADLQALAESLRAEGLAAYAYPFPLYYDDVAEAILTARKQQRADLVVMSTHGRGGLGRWLYGSVADEVLRRSDVPVLLIPAACDRPLPEPGDDPPRVLVPLDGTPLAEAALAPAVTLAETLHAEIHLLRVVAPIRLPVSEEGLRTLRVEPEAEIEEAHTYLTERAHELRPRGRAAQVQVAVHADPASAIAAATRTDCFTLVAMATHGRSGLARMVLGSVTTGTLHRIHVPMLLVHPVRVPEARQARSEAAEEAPGSSHTPAVAPV